MRERTRTYRLVLGALAARSAGGGGSRSEGSRRCPGSGSVLLVGNHDSHWDPVLIGLAARRRRQIRALAKSDLWKVRGLAPILNGMGQIPIERGEGDRRPSSGRSRS